MPDLSVEGTAVTMLAPLNLLSSFRSRFSWFLLFQLSVFIVSFFPAAPAVLVARDRVRDLLENFHVLIILKTWE
jgi:hypothetical protein